MNYSVMLFLFGLLISVLLPILEEEIIAGFNVDLNIVIENMFSLAPHVWKLGYSALLVFILPSMLIPKLKKQLVEKHSKTYSFLTGNTFGYAIIEIISFSLSTLSFYS
jgi:hypothetical protein